MTFQWFGNMSENINAGQGMAVILILAWWLRYL
jgi:hypothetical protein